MADFQGMTRTDLAVEYVEINTKEDLAAFYYCFEHQKLTALQLAEAFAEENDLPSSEEEVSRLFDDNVAPSVIEEYGPHDDVAMSEAFNNWTDGLEKDGQLHALQVYSYSYVGEHASE